MEGSGGLSKIVTKNHQYLGVNNSIKAVHTVQDNDGRLGVFWHTQGSGKSISMVFFCQKVLRKIPGNWTFVIITDRTELDTQIYKNFEAANAVNEAKVQASSVNHLRELLSSSLIELTLSHLVLIAVAPWFFNLQRLLFTVFDSKTEPESLPFV